MKKQKVKIYKDIICLEFDSVEGLGWWYMGANLAYTPIHIKDLKKVKAVILEGTRKRLIVAVIKSNNKDIMVAINLVRSDIEALQKKGFWHESIQAPYKKITYSPIPEKKTYTGK